MTGIKQKISLENDIAVFLLAQDVARLESFSRSRCDDPILLLLGLSLSSSKYLRVGSGVVSLFLTRHLFETIEFLSIEFVKLGVNVFDMVRSVQSISKSIEEGIHLIVFSVRGMMTCSLRANVSYIGKSSSDGTKLDYSHCIHFIEKKLVMV